MITSEINAGDYGRIGQYNDLRKDAKASSYLVPQSNEDLTLKINAGVFHIDNEVFNFDEVDTDAFTTPVSGTRIDTLVLKKGISVTPPVLAQTSRNSEYTINANGTFFYQEFTVPEGYSSITASALKLFMRETGGSSTTNQITVAIEKVSIRKVFENPVVATVTPTIPMSSTMAERTFTFSSAFELEAGSTYAIRISRASGTFYLGTQSSDVYSGDAYERTVAHNFWVELPTTDAYFEFVLTDAIDENYYPYIYEGSETWSENDIPVCKVLNRSTQTKITEVDDTSNGYIYEDLRNFLDKDIVDINKQVSQKTITKSIISNVTFQKDDDLVVTLEPFSSYRVTATIFYTAEATPDIKFRLNKTSGLFTRIYTSISDSHLALSTQVNTVSSTITDHTITISESSTFNGKVVFETIIHNETMPDLFIEWAQRSSSTGESSVLLGSTIEAIKLN